MNTGETPQADPAEVTEVQETPSIRRVGQQLRDAREAKGLNVAEIAARLKLTQRQMEALEADLHEHIHLENNILYPKSLAQEANAEC